MKRTRTVLIALLALVISSTAAFAQEPKTDKQRKQVIIREGQVFLNDNGRALDLHRAGLLSRTYIGVNLVTLSSELKAHFGAGDHGTLISTVASDSPAARAGLRVGDVITSVNGQKVGGPGDVTRAIREKKAGDSVRVDFVRGGVAQHVFITVAEREARKLDVGSIVTPEMLRATEAARALTLESAEKIGEYFRSPEWESRVEQFQDCAKVQGRVRELETRLKVLEKRLAQ